MSTNKIHWLGHASIRIEGEKVIYIDPWKLQDNHPKADIILITHSHYDHCSRDDVAKIIQDGTVIFAPRTAGTLSLPIFRWLLPGRRRSWTDW